MQRHDAERELLQMAVEQGMLTPSQRDALLGERESRTPRTSAARLAIEKGLLTEEATRELETRAWLSRLPEELEGYRIARLLGRGGMAVVFEAQDVSLGKVVAVKVLLPEFCASETYLTRFHREARIAAKLTHPNTVQVFRAGEVEGVHYLVMEYVEGDTLSDVIKARGRIPEREAVEIVRQVSGALAEAASLGIVHRDIKPANILMSKWGLPKLTDFGIAREFSDIADPAIQMSLTMGVVGTPTYMSPEQARGARKLDFRSDIYSLGATLYHAVLGEVPFFAETPQEAMVRVVSETPPPPRTVMPELSEETAAVICRMMAKDPDDRYDSFEALEADLEAARDGEPVSLSYEEAVRLLLPSRREAIDAEEAGAADKSSPWRIAAVAVAVAVAGLILLLLLRSCLPAA